MTITISLPPWLQQLNAPQHFDSMAAAMKLAIAAARRNSLEGGGPFGAAVVDENLELVSLGVNLVIPAGSSIFHAEMVALLLAEQKLGSHSLAARGNFTLLTSCEPCAMCFGALPFAGIAHVVCAATTADAQAIGFDEGDKPECWQDSLKKRGIAVTTGLLRSDAVAVLDQYRSSGGRLY
ncbi:MAG: nucleoside deaminase [Porticoccaceae bacterium]|nr:nucleoside deaminase [Porticoccaceae bacterium]